MKWFCCMCYSGRRDQVRDARQNFGFYERIVFVYTGIGEVSDEEQLDFFEYTQVPIEPYEISLDHFKTQIMNLNKE